MKFNWGTGIALTLISFVSLMSFMVYKSMQQEFDLVTEDYYAEEIGYQKVIDNKTNALNLKGKACISNDENGLFLFLPDDLANKTKDLEIHMYCELKANNDFSLTEKNTTANRFTIPGDKMTGGKWIAKVKLKCEGVEYYFEPEITL